MLHLRWFCASSDKFVWLYSRICGSSGRFVFRVWRGPQAPRWLGACATGPRKDLDPPPWRPWVRFFAVSSRRGAVGTE